MRFQDHTAGISEPPNTQRTYHTHTQTRACVVALSHLPVDVIEGFHFYAARDPNGPRRVPSRGDVQLAIFQLSHYVHACLLWEETEVVVGAIDRGVEPAVGDGEEEVVRVGVEVAGVDGKGDTGTTRTGDRQEGFEGRWEGAGVCVGAD